MGKTVILETKQWTACLKSGGEVVGGGGEEK